MEENTTTVLKEACKMIGWQGGTIHQVKEHIRSLNVQNRGSFLNLLKERIEHDNDLFKLYMAEYAPLRIEHLEITSL